MIARELAYHGTTSGALAATGLPSVRTPFEPLAPGACHVAHTDTYRGPPGLWAADAIEARIRAEGAETVAAVILEPVQNSGGCLVPPPGYFERVRAICDRHGVLLISDDTICSWGRLGTWFGGQRFGYVPDLITTAKGLTSGYVPMGAVIVAERIAAGFEAQAAAFAHGLTFGGHPVAAAVALANLALIEREDLLGRVRTHEPALRAALEGLRDIPIVGDVRGAGYFWGLELVADPATKRPVRRPAGGRGGRVPGRRPAPPRADLPRRGPRLPGDPARAAADRRPGGVRRDRGDPARRPDRRGGARARARGGVTS